jgi:cytochrome c biogenesis protein CcdA/thiol-disulfide isomerase/thioredoxin
MLLFIIAYMAGLLTIAAPCIWPILPFVLGRADEPFHRGGLPMLVGLAVAFAATASLAALGGGWAVHANHYGRTVALAFVTMFGLTMIVPSLAERMTRPIVTIGSRLLRRTGQRAISKRTVATSMLVGVATGLVWAPCAGPVLGVILTTAALQGPSIKTSFLLFAYGLGAATSLAAGLLFIGRLLVLVKQSARCGDYLRRILGAAVVAGAATIWLGFDPGALTILSSARAYSLEQDLLSALPKGPRLAMSSAAYAAPDPYVSGPLGSLLAARQWLNTQPLSPADVRGKVVLVNFWTYSCINCLRMLPHVRAWADKYKDRGLVVIGVETPEFSFEKVIDNVRNALPSLGVGYPVAIDNEFDVWRAFDNEAWPALYFIDVQGRVRHHVFGEGGYDRSEKLIQQLLSEADDTTVSGDIVALSGNGPEAAPDDEDLRSPETYIGYTEARNFASPGGVHEDVSSLYQTIAAPPLNRWTLAGTWTIGGEFATLNRTPGSITYRFHARDLNLVLAPSSSGHCIRFRVTMDGAPPGKNHGVDVDASGLGCVRDARMYQLVRQAEPVIDRTFEIEFIDPGVGAYDFTFG